MGLQFKSSDDLGDKAATEPGGPVQECCAQTLAGKTVHDEGEGVSADIFSLG